MRVCMCVCKNTVYTHIFFFIAFLQYFDSVVGPQEWHTACKNTASEIPRGSSSEAIGESGLTCCDLRKKNRPVKKTESRSIFVFMARSQPCLPVVSVEGKI